MPRIIRTEAVCLAAERYKESSKLVTLLSRDSGILKLVAKGARRPRNRFGAALERFSASRVTYYWHENRSIYTLSDAELIQSYRGLSLLPARFLAAEQITEFLLRTGRPYDPLHARPQEGAGRIYRLIRAYLAVLEESESGFSGLVASFLLKAASFLGFAPDLERCAVCRRRVGAAVCTFDPQAGGIVCDACGPVERSGLRELLPAQRKELARLLSRPAAEITSTSSDFLALALTYASCHLDPPLLNSFHWQEL